MQQVMYQFEFGYSYMYLLSKVITIDDTEKDGSYALTIRTSFYQI